MRKFDLKKKTNQLPLKCHICSLEELSQCYNYDKNNRAYNEKGESLFTRFQQLQGYQNVALQNVKLAHINYLSNFWKPNVCKGT